MYLPQRQKAFKIILTQLPFRFYNLGLTKQINNMPLAAGFLKAMAFKEGLIKNIDIKILDPLTADVTSDNMLIKTILGKKPNIVGFSLYVWNLTRSLYVIQEIKKFLPKTTIVVGGPSVTEEFNYISPQGVDFAIKGEGEISFAQLVKYLLEGQPPLRSISNLIFKDRDKIICNPYVSIIDDINEIPSPYLSGCLDPRIYRRYWIETMRWCAYQCKYCLYHCRSQMKNPFYSLERITEELNYAKKIGVNYIDLHDSAFNLNPKFKEICRNIQIINEKKSFYLTAFLQAELLNEEDVDSIANANILEARIGLQTINSKTLRNIGRNTKLEMWLRGVKLLRKKGIRVSIDIMIGLPGDNLKSTLKTIEFLKENKLGNHFVFSILSVGPSTAIYKEAKKLGIIKFQSQPPYLILKTKQMSFLDIKKAFVLSKFHIKITALEDRFPSFYEYIPPFLHTYCQPKYPYYAHDKKNDIEIKEEHLNDIPVTKIIININPQTLDINYFKELGSRLSDRIANNLTVWFQMSSLISTDKYLEMIIEFLRYLSKPNPYNIWNIILEGCSPLSIQEERDIKQSISYLPNELDYREIYKNRNYGKKEFYRVSTKLLYILPTFNNRYRNGITPKIEENRKVFHNVFIDSATDLSFLIQKPYITKNEGILVDFSSKLNPYKIIEMIRLLREKKDNYAYIRFKNVLLQAIWYKYFVRRYSTYTNIINDLSLHIDINKNEKLLFISYKIIMMDMAEFILSLRKFDRYNSKQDAVSASN